VVWIAAARVLAWAPQEKGTSLVAKPLSSPDPSSPDQRKDPREPGPREPGPHEPGPHEGTREESQAERDDRNLGELLQELRVATLGVQVLFGFLLSLPFTTRFSKLSHGQRDLYLASLVFAGVAIALLLGPVAYHRLVFRRGQKEGLVQAASVMAITGLGAVGLAILAAVLLVTSFVASGLTAALITGFIVVLFGTLWLAFPLARRREHQSHR
jgi:hypothetical protein